MAATKKGDMYANLAKITVTESAANTLTFALLNIMTGNFMEQKYGVILHRIEWTPGYNSTIMNATGDELNLAITISNAITGISDLGQPEVVVLKQFKRIDIGTAASGYVWLSPTIDDFSSLPGGGILLPADRIYLAAHGASLTAATTNTARIWYTIKPMEVAEYWDLIEARRIMT